MIDDRHQKECEEWNVEREKLEHDLRYEAPRVFFTIL